MKPNSQPNPNKILNSIVTPGAMEWVTKNTAILVVHGIGNQLPLETLDQFGRGLIKEYRKVFDDELTISHEIIPKPDDGGGVWFDNVLRIHKANSGYYIDLYEYYWANYCPDKASWKDLNYWLQGVVKGANTFYKKNAMIGQQYKDKSPFFDSKTGKFKPLVYWFFMAVVSKIFLMADVVWRAVIWAISLIPFGGKIADSLLESYVDSMLHDICNTVSEVAIYNAIDPKSKFYDVRRKILDGAVKAVSYLIERPADINFHIDALTTKIEAAKLGAPQGERNDLDATFKKQLEDQELYYPSVIIAGHSLGTQVTYDAINKLSILVNTGKISTYDENGICKLKYKTHLSNQLNGYITFGCPLDKIIFFLRENVPDNEYLRQQFLDNYHKFKQRDIDFANNAITNPDYLKASCNLKHLLETVQWRNYYDHKDYVSGGLDYYTKLINIDCRFKAGTFGFTHSYYWTCENFYIDIICNYLT